MKNKLLFIMALALGIFSEAQIHRFIYDVIYKKDSASEVATKENYILDIGKSETKYYIYDYFVADSLIKNNIPFPAELKLNTSNILVHKTNSNDFAEYDLLENTVLKLQTADAQNWKLSSEKKKVKEFNLQKATAIWGGRNWTAWFCAEIPFQEGPYKFHGLPGLIFEIYDDKNNYDFRLSKSQNLKAEEDNPFISEARKMAIAVSWEKYKETKLRYYDSPLNFIKNAVGTSDAEEFFLNDGTVVNAKNRREINERLRNSLLKFNNPIEKDRAIRYGK